MTGRATITRAQVEELLAEYARGASWGAITAWPRSGALTIVTDDPARLALAVGYALGAAMWDTDHVNSWPGEPAEGWEAVAVAMLGRVDILQQLSSGLPGEVVFPDLTLIEDDSKEIA